MRPGYPRPGTRQPPASGDTFVPGALGTIPRVEPWRRWLDARRSMALHSCRSSRGQFRFRRSGRALSAAFAYEKERSTCVRTLIRDLSQGLSPCLHVLLGYGFARPRSFVCALLTGQNTFPLFSDLKSLPNG